VNEQEREHPERDENQVEDLELQEGDAQSVQGGGKANLQDLSVTGDGGSPS
jgi:hypothetical protein